MRTSAECLTKPVTELNAIYTRTQLIPVTQTSKSDNRIFGFGELSVDHLFVGCEVNTALYLESAGGGSVWNTLANLSAFGRHSVAAIVGPGDNLGRLAVDSLKSVGVSLVSASERSTPSIATSSDFFAT